MKRKLFTGIAAIICIFAISLAFSACTVGKHEHSYTTTVVSPTCAQKGYTLHSCDCGYYFKDNETETLAHTPKEVDEKPATCKEVGYTAGVRCAVCDVAIKDSLTIPKLEHNVVVTDGKSATCEEDGYTESSKCSACGDIISEREIIPAKGHDYSLWKFEREVTCTIDGRRVSICPDCGNRTEETVKAPGHRGRADAAVSEENCVVCHTSLFTPRAGNSAYGYYDLYYTEKGTLKQNLYYNVYLACEKLFESREDLEEQTAVVGKDEQEITYYAVDRIDLSDCGLTYDEIFEVWQVFYVENPVYFWLTGEVMFINAIFSDDDSTEELAIKVDAEFANYARRSKAQTSIDEMTAKLNKLLGTGLDDRQKAIKIHDFLADEITYAYKSDGKTPETSLWAHNILGAAENKKGVCETYAKTYLYLCLKSGVNCIKVTGDANGSHAWNYIEIDGVWYGADVTWDDAGKTPTKNYLGANESRMNGEHKPNLAENGYYDLPELSKKALDLNL